MDHFCQISICPGEGRLSVHMTSNYNPVKLSLSRRPPYFFQCPLMGLILLGRQLKSSRTLSVEDQNKEKIIVTEDHSKILMFYMIVGRETYCVHW